MTIKLEYMELKNFKGIRYLGLNADAITNIYGANGTGKTTIVDAFRWLLFDKDSTDRKDFEIKTLDKNNQPIHFLEHTVTAEIWVDGKLKTFEKIYKEKWNKKRGESQKEFTGHETLYSLDDVPLKKNEYKEEIRKFIDEVRFKILTDPFCFSQLLSWQERREALMLLGDEITNEDVFVKDEKLRILEEALSEKDVSTFRKSLSSRRRKLNDEIKAIPYRIDECSNSIKSVDFAELTKQLSEKSRELISIEEQLTNLTAIDPELEKKKKVIKEKRVELEKKKSEFTNYVMVKQSKLQNELTKATLFINGLKNVRENLLTKKESLENRRNSIEADMIKLREDWEVAYSLTFELTDDFVCPTCNRELDTNVVQQKKAELKENFNTTKANDLSKINEVGKKYAEQKKNIEDDLAEVEAQTTVAESDIEKKEPELLEIKNNIEANSEYETPAEITILEDEIQMLVDGLVDVNDKNSLDLLRLDKNALRTEIDELKESLHQEKSNKELRIRIDELKARERELSQQIADLEKQEFLSERFEKNKAELLEAKINGLFKIVKFKLFETQVNGGITPTCTAMVNGVPFPDVNNAGKYNAGIDIINTLSNYYNISAPIFIDNREGVTEIIETDAQLINFYVSPKDEQLRIETFNKSQTKVA